MIDVTGEVTKKRYVGEFTCRIPRKKEQCLIDKHRAFLNGGMADQLEPGTLKFHHMVAYLRYTIDDKVCPKWWKDSDLGYEMFDVAVIEEVYNKVLEFEVEWLKQVWGEEAVNQKLQAQGSKEADGKPEAGSEEKGA